MDNASGEVAKVTKITNKQRGHPLLLVDFDKDIKLTSELFGQQVLLSMLFLSLLLLRVLLQHTTGTCILV